MLPQKPYAISCDRNSEPILESFKKILENRTSLIEIGAGTGQHAIFMAPSFPNLVWTLADRVENHEGISLWLNDFPRSNIRGPIEYEIGKDSFPKGEFDTFFAANVLHIISWEMCLQLFDDLSKLPQGTLILFYGAFNYNGEFTSESNERFEKWLKDRDSKSGIRNFEDVCSELEKRDIELQEDIEMPANNRMLVFKVKT